VEHWKSLPIYQWGANKVDKSKTQPQNQNPKKPQPVKSQEIINFVKATTEKSASTEKVYQAQPVINIPAVSAAKFS
jgi:hypothetical protein